MKVPTLMRAVGLRNPELRAALVVTTLLGITIGHQFLGLPAHRDASADHIAALLRPAIKALAGPVR